MQGYEKELFEIANKINNLTDTSQDKNKLIQDYNDVLYYIVPFLEKPLPKECIIDDKFILTSYKELVQDFKTNGNYTFKRSAKKADIIAEIVVNSNELVQDNNYFLVTATILHLYKGDTTKNQLQFYVSNFHSIRAANFEINKKYFILLVKSDPLYDIDNTDIYIYNNCYLITENNSLQYVICDDVTSLEYWGNTDIEILEEDDYIGYTIKIKYENIVKHIHECLDVYM